MTESQISNDIREGGSKKEMAVRLLIRDNINIVHKVTAKLGISAESAQDAYTDSILVLVKHLETGVFRGESKLGTYLYRIFYNKCVDVFRKKTTNKIELVEEVPDTTDESRDIVKNLLEQEDMKFLEQYLKQLKERCNKVLMDWGFWGYSMEEIAHRNGLKDAKTAKNEKWRCLKSLKEIIKKDRFKA